MIPLPGPLNVFVRNLFEISNFDMMSGDVITGKFLTFSQEEPINERWGALKDSDSNFLMNTGSMMIPIFVLMLI